MQSVFSSVFSLLLSLSWLVCKMSFALRGQIKFEIKSNPVASISTQSKIRRLTPNVTPPQTFPVTFILSHLLKSSNNPVKRARCGVLLRSGSFLSELLGVSPKRLRNSTSVLLIGNEYGQIAPLLTLNTHLRFSAVCLFRCSRPSTHWGLRLPGLIQFTSLLNRERGRV